MRRIARCAGIPAMAVCIFAASSSPRGQAQSRQHQPQPALCPGVDSIGLRLTYFDVGQGDATLVRSPDGRHLLIDGGRSSQRVAAMLSEREVPSLDLVIATHNHADHIGGLALVINSFPVANLLENGLPTTTAVYAALVRAASRAKVRGLGATARTLNVGSVSVRVLSTDLSSSSQNGRSVGAVVSYGAFSAIFSGDAEPQTLERWLASERIPRATVVMAGHHGAENGVTTAWVLATSPAVVVISVGGTNSYGHPSRQTLAWWHAQDRRIVRTDLDGTVDVRGCRDGTFTMSTSRGAIP